MNKKKINFILIPGVLLIWALILIKIFSYSKNPKNEINYLQTPVDTHDSISEADTIIIYAKYRDPFFPSNIKMISSQKSIETSIKPVQTSVKTIISWPKVTYGGLIKSLNNGNEHVLLIISDQTIVTGVNSEIEGIKILAGYPDSLKIQFKKETKTISKN